MYLYERKYVRQKDKRKRLYDFETPLILSMRNLQPVCKEYLFFDQILINQTISIRTVGSFSSDTDIFAIDFERLYGGGGAPSLSKLCKYEANKISWLGEKDMM